MTQVGIRAINVRYERAKAAVAAKGESPTHLLHLFFARRLALLDWHRARCEREVDELLAATDAMFQATQDGVQMTLRLE